MWFHKETVEGLSSTEWLLVLYQLKTPNMADVLMLLLQALSWRCGTIRMTFRRWRRGWSAACQLATQWSSYPVMSSCVLRTWPVRRSLPGTPASNDASSSAARTRSSNWSLTDIDWLLISIKCDLCMGRFVWCNMTSWQTANQRWGEEKTRPLFWRFKGEKNWNENLELHHVTELTGHFLFLSRTSCLKYWHIKKTELFI